MENPFENMVEQIIAQQRYFASLDAATKTRPDVQNAVLHLSRTRGALETCMVNLSRQRRGEPSLPARCAQLPTIWSAVFYCTENTNPTPVKRGISSFEMALRKRDGASKAKIQQNFMRAFQMKKFRAAISTSP